MGTPSAESMRSVWSREMTGSDTVVFPSDQSPERRIALFTCALAIGDS